jgi:DNA-binding GntR family transcriptional regulator
MSASTLRNFAIKDILDKIEHGEIKPDEIITEAQICDRLNISRTPVREALIELVASGILQKVPRKGYMICEIDNQYKLNNFEIIGALDALAAALAVPHITDADIMKMYEAADLMDIAIKYKNYASYCELQEKFHLIYIEKSDNPQLIKLLDEIKSSVDRCTYFSSDTERMLKLCAFMNDEHRYIIRLFEEKDTAQLEAFLKNHWKTKYQDMI